MGARSAHPRRKAHNIEGGRGDNSPPPPHLWWLKYEVKLPWLVWFIMPLISPSLSLPATRSRGQALLLILNLLFVKIIKQNLNSNNPKWIADKHVQTYLVTVLFQSN